MRTQLDSIGTALERGSSSKDTTKIRDSTGLGAFLRAREAFREKSIDETEKAPHFACEACQDTGYIFRDGATYYCHCYEKRTQDRIFRHSGIPEYTPQPLCDTAKKYVAEFDSIRDSGRNWMAFFGRSGTGKSTQAYTASEALIRRINPVRVRVQIYSSLIRRLSAKRFEKEEFDYEFNELSNDCDLFVWDDLFDTIPQPDSFEEQTAISLIKARYDARKPMILTSELLPNDFLSAFGRGESLIGRISEMCNGRMVIYGQQSKNYRISR